MLFNGVTGIVKLCCFFPPTLAEYLVHICNRNGATENSNCVEMKLEGRFLWNTGFILELLHSGQHGSFRGRDDRYSRERCVQENPNHVLDAEFPASALLSSLETACILLSTEGSSAWITWLHRY